MREAVICMPLRTPVGRYGGVAERRRRRDAGRADHRRPSSSARASTRRRSTTASSGQGYPSGESPAIGRTAALGPACLWRCRACRSTAAAAPACRRSASRRWRCRPAVADVVLAGGVESMSNVEFYATGLRSGNRRGNSRCATASTAAASPPAARTTRSRAACWRRRRTCAGSTRSPREEQDELALRSHQRAVAAWDAGQLRRRDRAGDRDLTRRRDTMVDRDEHPRADTSLEKLAALRRCACVRTRKRP